jgi:hypothetical protein
VHALLHHRVVQVFQMRVPAAHGDLRYTIFDLRARKK